MAVSKAKIGDVYVCKVGDESRYFQYVCDDSSQLGSQVVAVFRRKFSEGEEVNFENITSLEIEFFAHVFIAFGLKMKSWSKVTNVPAIGFGEVLFRSTNDYGKPEVAESDDWWIWTVNGPKKHVGSLVDELRKSFIGVVMAPPNIVARLTTGKYSYVYPSPAGDSPYWE